MSTLEPSPATLQFRAAMEARDLAAIVDTFAPDAVFRSPITDKLSFNGHEQIAAISEVILDVFDDLQYTVELRGEHTGFLVGNAIVDGQPIEWVDHLRLGPDGKIHELTVFLRPLPATATALRLSVRGSAGARAQSEPRSCPVLARPL